MINIMEDVIKTEEHLDYLVGKIFSRFWRKGFRETMMKLGLDEFKDVIRFGISKALSQFDMTKLKGSLDGYLIWKGYFCTIDELRSMQLVWRPKLRKAPPPIQYMREADSGVPIEDDVGKKKRGKRLDIDVDWMLNCLFYSDSSLLRAHYINGIEQKELCKKLGITRSGLSIRLKRIREDVRKAWQGRELEFLSWEAA